MNVVFGVFAGIILVTLSNAIVWWLDRDNRKESDEVRLYNQLKARGYSNIKIESIIKDDKTQDINN